MAWKVTIGEKSMLLDDLSQEDFMAALAKYPDVSWLRVYYSPGAHPGAYYELLRIAAEKMNVDPPAPPSTMKETVALLQFVKEVDDDRPKEWSEGAIPLDEAADPETITSSTSTEPEVGRQNKPAARH